MKLAITASGLCHVARGVETWAAETARAFHQMGEDVTLFKGSGLPKAPYERVCSCVQRGCGLNTFLNRLLPRPFWHVGLGSSYEIEETTFALHLIPLIANGYDIIHTQDPLVALILQRARRMGLMKAPTVLAHGTEEPLRFLEKIDFVQHLAPFHLEEARQAGCHKEGWIAIGNSVDTEVFKPRRGHDLRARYGIKNDSFVVVSVAAVKSHHKRIDYLIREVADFRQATGRDMQLVIAGARTGETDGLTAMGRGMLGEAVHFLLDQPHERMPEIYGLGDIFVLCSLKEMMPIALLEATASGLPCLVSTHPVVKWMIGPGGEGIHMERPGALSSALKAYLDPQYRRAKGEAARRHALKNFSKEVIVKQYLAMYRDVLARTNGRLA